MMERMPSEFWPDARLNVIADKIWQVFGRSPPPLPDEYFAFPFTAETLAFLPTRKLPPSMPEFAKRIRRIARWMVINGPYHCRDYDERLMQVIKTACSKDDTSNVKHFFQAAEIGLAGGPAFGPWMGFLGSVAWDGIMGPFKKLMTLEGSKILKVSSGQSATIGSSSWVPTSPVPSSAPTIGCRTN